MEIQDKGDLAEKESEEKEKVLQENCKKENVAEAMRDRNDEIEEGRRKEGVFGRKNYRKLRKNGKRKD